MESREVRKKQFIDGCEANNTNMKQYESQVIRENPSQKSTSIFKWVMFVLAFIAVVIVTNHKILKIEVRLFDGTNPGDKVIQDDFEFEPVKVTFRRYNLSYRHGNRVKGIFSYILL